MAELNRLKLTLNLKGNLAAEAVTCVHPISFFPCDFPFLSRQVPGLSDAHHIHIGHRGNPGQSKQRNIR